MEQRMTFTPEQVSALKAPLDARHVKQREQAGRKLSYIESWQAISEANRIFGFDGWNSVTHVEKLFDAYKDAKDKWRVGYMAKVNVTVEVGDNAYVTREGVGYGSGIDNDLGQAHESALKEAESDARKRALMTFGNPFGLALYDKQQANVTDANGTPKNEPADDGLPKVKNAPGVSEARKWTAGYIEEMRGVENKEAFIELLYGAKTRFIRMIQAYPGVYEGPDGSGLRGETMKISNIVDARSDFDTFIREVELMAKEQV
jgi:DNA repair and recombination protein RAD52